MLVLTRSLNEQIIVGDDIVVEVLQIGRNKVRLGVDAPIELPIHRREVFESILAEQRHNGIASSRIVTARPLPAPRKATPFADRLASLADEAHEMGDHDAYLTLETLSRKIELKGRA